MYNNLEELNFQKAVLRTAFHRVLISEETFNKRMEEISQLEERLLKKERLKAIKVNDLKNKLYDLVTN